MEKLHDGDPPQLGRYILQGRLGSGGTGDVFLGESPDGRQVAIKFIRPELARDRGFRSRFERRVEAARKVGGAFAAPVVDADLGAQPPWVATEYVDGPSLQETVSKSGPLPFSSVLSLASGLARGLTALHAADVTHGDLKPSNVLLAPDRPRMIDFGFSQADTISPLAVAGRPMAVAGRDLGTPGYASPEQEYGDPAGPPSDIFSLGAVLAFAASGEDPHGKGSPEGIRRRVLTLAPRLDSVPGALRPLIERCMQRDPAKRPTAPEFLASLKAAYPDAIADPDLTQGGIVPDRKSSTTAVRQPPPRVPESPRRTPPWPEQEEPPPGPAAGGAPIGRQETPAPHTRNGRRRLAAISATATVSIGAAVSLAVTIPSCGSSSSSGSSGTAPTASAPASQSPIPGAALAWKGAVNYTVTSTPQPEWGWKRDKQSWEESWDLIPNCSTGPCSVTLRGSIGGWPFTVLLTRSGATYSGSTAVSDDWYCGSEKTNYEANTLYIKVTGTGAKLSGQWRITKFSGTVVWDIGPGPGGCSAGTYSMVVRSA